jgi:transposase-like protein
MQVEAMQWAQETFGEAHLGDVRRTRRLVRLAAQMLQDPQGSLPRQTQGNWSELKAAYRLLRADGVSHEAISHPCWQRSRRLAEQEEAEVLLVHDGTELVDGYQSSREGLGSIGNGSRRRARERGQHPEQQTVEPLEWILLTSLPVQDEQQAWHIVRAYQARWVSPQEVQMVAAQAQVPIETLTIRQYVRQVAAWAAFWQAVALGWGCGRFT